MNGAHALIHTLVDSGVDVCFANPGTSEMHFVAAVDDIPDLRIVLGLFEGVVTGAADGYARLTGRPAATLLHLGPGLANGTANLHNARRARVPMVNIVGDHATYHLANDPPLASDIEGIARTVSGWIGRPVRAEDIGTYAAQAVAAAHGPPSQIATIILPADVSWSEGALPAPPVPHAMRSSVDDGVVVSMAKLLQSGEPCAVLCGNSATDGAALRTASRVGTATGARVFLETSIARLERGGGIPAVERLNYRAGRAMRQLEGVKHLILVDAKPPVAFFAYPDRESNLVPRDCEVHVLSGPSENAHDALLALANRVALHADEQIGPLARPTVPTGGLTPSSIAEAVAALMPEQAVIIDEGVTSSGYVQTATSRGPRHDWLNVTGGAIGIGLPLSIGAAIGAPTRKVIDLQADGSAMYTIQALWTMARERLDITIVLYNNRQYAILRSELPRVGAVEGPKAFDMLDLSRPDLDFVAIAAGMGVDGERVTTAEGFAAAFQRGLDTHGPYLVEAMI